MHDEVEGGFRFLCEAQWRTAGSYEPSLFRPFYCANPCFFEFVAEMAVENPMRLSRFFALHLKIPWAQCRSYIQVELYMAYAVAIPGGVLQWCSICCC